MVQWLFKVFHYIKQPKTLEFLYDYYLKRPWCFKFLLTYGLGSAGCVPGASWCFYYYYYFFIKNSPTYSEPNEYHTGLSRRGSRTKPFRHDCPDCESHMKWGPSRQKREKYKNVACVHTHFIGHLLLFWVFSGWITTELWKYAVRCRFDYKNGFRIIERGPPRVRTKKKGERERERERTK